MDEIRRLRDDVETLRAMINAELDGNADHAILLAEAKLLREKSERLDDLESKGRIE